MRKLFGRTEPRLWTRPLRELTPETSLGFEVIEFALMILGVDLYPWQKWLLVHALELREDGTYRFRRVIVLVGRQNGKTTLASVLAAWWLFVDSARRPDRVPPLKFKVVGVAQNLDIAREPWNAVKMWCDPDPETEEDAALAVEDLQDATAKVIDTNGKEAIIARSRAHYEIRAAKNARGKPAAKILMDEMREQRDWSAWNAVSQTTKSFWNGMLVGFSNAGDLASVVLRHQRNAALIDLVAAGFDVPDYIDHGLEAAEAYANGEEIEADASLGLFEWSAVPGCAKNDIDAILQSNPSIGYGSMTVEICLADIRGMTDAGYRTEVLCQWVTSKVASYLDVNDWKGLHKDPQAVAQLIPRGARTVFAVDMGHNREMTWIAASVMTDAGKPFVTVRTKRPGWAWVVPWFVELAGKVDRPVEIALQTRGVPAMDYLKPLQEASEKLVDEGGHGFVIHAIEWGPFALATGRLSDRVRDKELILVEQPDVDLAVEGGVVAKYAENLGWSREKSLPVDIAGLCAMTEALYALEALAPPPRKPPPPPPPPAELVTRGDVAPSEVNLATAAF